MQRKLDKVRQVLRQRKMPAANDDDSNNCVRKQWPQRHLCLPAHLLRVTACLFIYTQPVLYFAIWSPCPLEGELVVAALPSARAAGSEARRASSVWATGAELNK